MAFFYLWIQLKSISWSICNAAIGIAMQNDDVYAMYLPFMYEDKLMCCLVTVLIILHPCVKRYPTVYLGIFMITS